MCPVTAAMATTAALTTGGAAAVSAGLATGWAVAAGVAVGAGVGAGIGIATNAAINVATGRGAFDNWGKAALFGAVSGGVGSYAKPFADVAALGGGGFFGQAAQYAVTGAGGWAIAGSTALGSLAAGMMPSNVGYTPAAAYNQQAQALNMNTNIATTGSGGRQAATSLAAAISRTKKRKLTQDDVGDLSLDTSSFTNTGLQLA